LRENKIPSRKKSVRMVRGKKKNSESRHKWCLGEKTKKDIFVEGVITFYCRKLNKREKRNPERPRVQRYRGGDKVSLGARFQVYM